MNAYKVILFVLLCSLITESYSQTTSPRIKQIEHTLDSLETEGVVALGELMDISFSSISISEFIHAFGRTSGLNISIDPTIKFTLSVSFTNERPKNIFVYLCKTYGLDVEITGTIISLKQFVDKKPVTVKPLQIQYDSRTALLGMDLKQENLDDVVKLIAQLTGQNIILSPPIRNNVVSLYLEPEPIEMALSSLAYANDLEFVTENGAYFFEKSQNVNTQTSHPNIVPKNSSFQLLVKKDSSNGQPLLDVSGTNIKIADIIRYASDQLKLNYFTYSDLQGTITLRLENIEFEELIRFLFSGTNYTFNKDEGFYLFGERKREDIRSTEVIRLKHRSVDKILEVVPGSLKQDVEVTQFNDLNSIIISGSKPRIDEFKHFIEQIDEPVPLLYLELIIIDYRRGRTVSTGISAGISDSTVKTSGTFLPGLDMTFSSGSINNFLSKITGSTALNLGQVTPNFYIGLQALEEQDRVDIRSTPKLSTLNGHEATLSIGETVYYSETQSNFIGTENPQTVVSEQFKEASADIRIKMLPFISEDEHVTISIEVEVSNFQGTPSSNAPPNTFTRSFQSEIRAYNNDMIVLGGLEDQRTSEGGSGLPGVSRVRVLNKIFGKRSKGKSSSQLIIFIKPTIVY